jgi:hypothetical protein
MNSRTSFVISNFRTFTWRTSTLQRLLDRTCMNLRSNRITPTEPGFRDGRTEWNRALWGLTWRISSSSKLPLIMERISSSKGQVKSQDLPSLSPTVAKPRFSRSEAITSLVHTRAIQKPFKCTSAIYLSWWWNNVPKYI